MAQSIALDEYVLKMPLGIQIGSLGAENDNLEVTMGFFPFFFTDPQSAYGKAETRSWIR